jgi:TPR repeat protein
MRPLLAAALVSLICTPALAQSLPPPERPAATWDTQVLVNEAHNLPAEALPDLRRRAAAGDSRSQVLLGLVFEMGAAGEQPQPAEALGWFLKAAGQGVAWAEVWAADFYFSGSPGVPRDMYKALELYKSAANHGDPRAAFFVGQMYFFGDGVMSNHREAAAWFRRATPADPEVVSRMVALSEAPCDSKFCVSLRQVVGALMVGLADRFAGDWNETTREWNSLVDFPDSDRCGLTSTDRTEDGDVRNFFCDSPLIAEDAQGTALEKQLADAVQTALPPTFERRDDLTRPNPATFFSQEGYPHVRVSFNVTPGDATRRVTLLVGP